MYKRTKEKVSKVDYRLLYKKRIVDFLESLKGKDHTVWQLDESMNKLFNMGEQVVPVCLDKLKEGDESLAPVVCYALEYADDYDVVEPLMDMLILPNISDKIKARILTVLSHYGIDAGELPLNIIMNDFDKVAADSLAEMIEDINNDVFLIPYILDDLEEFTLDMKLAYVNDIGNLKDEKSIPILEIMATIDEAQVAQEAIKALGKIKSGKALFTLNKLLNFLGIESVKKTAEREIQRLKFSGVQMEICKPRLKLKEAEKVIISSMDGLGSRAIWVAWKNPLKKGKLSSMNLLINADTGIRDCWGVSQITSDEFNSTINDLEKTTVVVEEDMDYALTLIRDALYHNYQRNAEIPYQFFFWKYILEQSYNLKPYKYKPVFPGYSMKEIAIDEELFKKTFDLFSYNIFDDWFVAEPRVYDYAEQNKSKKGYLLKKMTHQKTEKLFSEFTKELIEPQRNVLRRMLELTADFSARSKNEELTKTVLCAYVHMDIEPLHYHPFIQRMVIESIRVALNNMKNGFDMRINPDAFE